MAYQLPELKSDAAKELAPYLITILKTQAILLEKAEYQLPEQADATALPGKDDLFDYLLRMVVLESGQAR